MKSPLLIAASAAFMTTGILAAVSASANGVIAAGSFKGANNHITTGGVSVVKTANGGAVVILDTNFSLDGAPDPRVGFGKNGKYAAATDIGALQKNAGLQVFVVPPSVNINDFNEVYVWCKSAALSLGVAPLN